MEPELTRRARDLARRAEKYAAPTHTAFLTPAEQQQLRAEPGLEFTLHGGGADCERQCAFFLPAWMEADALDPAEAISALRITAAFGTPGHRDYLGALLGLGLRRDCLGDLRLTDGGATLFCLGSIEDYLLQNLEKVGRCGVKVAKLALSEVPAPVRDYQAVRFTVQSLRLDAVCGGMFGLSRTSAQAQIAQGNVSVNYLPCLKPDLTLRPGDVIALRGHGKGTVGEAGGTSRKGRQFIEVMRWK